MSGSRRRRVLMWLLVAACMAPAAVVTAADGREAVEVFREQADAVDCVLLDLTMPRMDGEEAYRELRRIRRDVPVILASGYDEDDVARRFPDGGLAGFVQKPYEQTRLVATIQRVLLVSGDPDSRGQCSRC